MVHTQHIDNQREQSQCQMYVMFVLPGSPFCFCLFIITSLFIWNGRKKGAHDSPGCILGNVGHQRPRLLYRRSLFLFDSISFLFPLYFLLFLAPGCWSIPSTFTGSTQHLVTALIDIHPHVMNGYCTRGTFGAWQQIAPKQKKKID
jgi:hypothetical protein